MHILIGAVVGATFALATVGVMALVTGRKPSLKNVLLTVLGGAVGGAITSATLGASSLVGISTTRQVVAFTAGGAVGGASEQVADNAVEGRELHHDLGRATAVGGGSGLLSLGMLRGTRAVVTRISPRLTPSNTSLVGRILTAPVPGTGGGVVRSLEEKDQVTDEPPEEPRMLPRPGRSVGLAGALGR